MNGVLVIDKPKGLTSHDVVARVREVLKVRKAGHGGTLDPLATGVLPVYLGEATKLVPFNLDGTKEYGVTIRLGQETDTLDAEGKIVSEGPVASFSREEIEGVLGNFRGAIRQRPPSFSAIKRGGIPVYRKARAGKPLLLPERETRVFSLDLREVSLPFLRLFVACGRGTYIRSLAADIGRALGCGAHVVELRRLRSGLFVLAQALTLEEVADFAAGGRIQGRILPLQDSVELAISIQVDPQTAERVRQGKPLHFHDLSFAQGRILKKGDRVGLIEPPQGLFAIAQADPEGSQRPSSPSQSLRVLRVFHP